MEQFDLVNENDEVIGTTTKEKSHKDAELHRIAAIYVFDKHGNLYMQEHLKYNKRYDNSVGVHVRKGESYDEAVKREGYEELGLTDQLHKISVFHPDKALAGSKNIHMYGLYEVTPSKKWKFVPNKEVETIIPLPIEKIVQMMNTAPDKFVSGFIYTMREYIKQKQLPYKIRIPKYFTFPRLM